ncbi:MAG: hypothetical protein HP496_03200 [Nitrospira sp.]|nr:hypothetical protein [Nitrospira sp.]
MAVGLVLVSLLMEYASPFAGNHPPPISAQQSTRTSPYVGSAMAVLATLEQAQVLPPEGSREADRIVQSVIQLQSAFTTGTDRFMQEFAHRAVAAKHGENAPTVLERFRSRGWTADMLEALADADLSASDDERQQLTTGLGPFNLSVDDFTRLMQLVRDGRAAFVARGKTFAEIYASRRNAMPGAEGR